MQRIPARIGDPLEAVETPALVVDLDAFEHNLDLMANAVRGSGLALRPHAKSHKCPDIAKAQVARGAIGICCQKVDEAAAFVAAGIADVLVTNEIVAPSKIARLAALAQSRDDRRPRRRRARDSGPLGRGRAGGRDACTSTSRSTSARGAAASCPARRPSRSHEAASTAKGLRFRGLHAYHGAAQHLRTAARAPRGHRARELRSPGKRDELIEAAGIAVPRRHRCRDRHVAARARQPRLYRAAARLVRVHGRRLRAQCAGARRARVRAEPVCAVLR